MRAFWAWLPVLIAIIAVCGMAMIVTGQDNRCTAAAVHLEWSVKSRTGADCVRDDDGTVIRP